MEQLPDHLIHDYTHLLERAIIELRYRIRYDDAVTIDEVHDYLDALHNIGPLLRGVGGWHVPVNIDADLRRYDDKWINAKDGAERRRSLITLLKCVRDGEYDGDSPVA